MSAGKKQVDPRRHPIEALMSVCSTLVLAVSLLAGNGLAQTAETEGPTNVDLSAALDGGDQTAETDGSTEPDIIAVQQALEGSVSGSPDMSREERRAIREARRKESLERNRLAKENAVKNEAFPSVVSPPGTLSGMAGVGGRQARSVSMPSPTAVARSAPMTSIEVSLKLDPRQVNGVYMEEGWVPPPISMHTGAQAGTSPTVEARAEGLDAKGQRMDISPEWIPADSEMVTVSPGQGNEVQITVKRAGQSSLRVTSQKIYTELSIMAWYEGNALQAEISEKP